MTYEYYLLRVNEKQKVSSYCIICFCFGSPHGVICTSIVPWVWWYGIGITLETLWTMFRKYGVVRGTHNILYGSEQVRSQ